MACNSVGMTIMSQLQIHTEHWCWRQRAELTPQGGGYVTLARHSLPSGLFCHQAGMTTPIWEDALLTTAKANSLISEWFNYSSRGLAMIQNVPPALLMNH